MSAFQDTGLNERAQHLLKVLVEYYLQEGQPIGSRKLSRDSGLDLSPASIRNVMSDLEDLGYLQSPHTSAGRIPTVRGYRFFVDSLLSFKQLQMAEVDSIRHALDPDLDSKQLVERASSMLSGITNLAGVVSIPKQDKFDLKHIEFIPLSDRRLLVVMVINEHDVQNRIIHVDRDFSQSELTEIANFLNSQFLGQDLRAVREAIIQEMKQARATANTLMLTAIQMAEKVLDTDESADYILMGETKLMEFAELGTLDRLKHLFEAFHQKQEILKLLDRCIQAQDVQIFIGDESGYEVLDECSIVTAPYSIDGELVGVLGVIGPTRMAYDRVIPIVDVTARLLGTALKVKN
ncbi:MAG: heat-inducible transcriptional repressor HrcA [Gammaproteobacteria bacterium]|nr:MAG: heat-inducible transcriptional repressor HrcA [Gammaproteobacteria bacterium]